MPPGFWHPYPLPSSIQKGFWRPASRLYRQTVSLPLSCPLFVFWYCTGHMGAPRRFSRECGMTEANVWNCWPCFPRLCHCGNPRTLEQCQNESLPAPAAADRIAPGLQDRPAGADEGCPEGCMGLTCSCLPQCDDLDPEIDEVQPDGR